MMATMEGSYSYQTLQPFRGIRLLRLLPSTDVTAKLEGHLLEYSLEEMYAESGSYDALSYAWGDVKASNAISIDGLKLPITANLQVALVHLRHQHVERLLWVDQLCIDQNNDKEKEVQIKLMSQIYACANCVIVWLGEEEDGSNDAMEELHRVGRERFTNSMDEYLASDGVSRLLQRAWFRRIWEVGVARRVQIRCGRSVIDGHTFALATEVLKPTSETCGEEQALHNIIHSAAFLIKQSIFRPLYHGPPESAGGTCTFGELVDMFHSREATRSHDKIYALLGMSLTDMNGSGLLPDYTVPFGQLIERLIRFIISNQLTIECQDDKEAAVFKGRGHVLGKITEVTEGIQTEQKKRVHVDWRTDAIPTGAIVKGFDPSMDLRVPAIPLQKGDLIILLEGAAEPSIIRVYEDFSTVIVAVAMLHSATNNDRMRWIPLEDSKSEEVLLPKRDFLLIWDWHYSLEMYSNLGQYTTWAESKGWMSASSNSKEANRLDYLARVWACAVIQMEGNEFGSARAKFRMCIREFDEILQTRESHTKGREHMVALIHSVIGMPSTALDPRIEENVPYHETLANEYIPWLFKWAIRERHNHVMDLVIGTGQVHEVFLQRSFEAVNDPIMNDIRDFMGWLLKKETEVDLQEQPRWMTSLQAAAWAGHLDTTCELLDEGADVNAEPFGPYGKTALQAAAEAGSLAVVERLLEVGADVNAPAGHDCGKTALQAAAKAGKMDIVSRLLRQNADVNALAAGIHGRTALQAAAEAGHMDIVQRLVQHHADVNDSATACQGRTALQAAAGAGHLHIVEWLIQKGANVNAPAARFNGRTALQAAAETGHLAISALLLKEKADVNARASQFAGRTALQAAAEAGDMDILELLIQGEADINARAGVFLGRTALMAAAEKGHLTVVERLIKEGAEVNATIWDDTRSKREKVTALGLAHSRYNFEIAWRLMKSGASTR